MKRPSSPRPGAISPPPASGSFRRTPSRSLPRWSATPQRSASPTIRTPPAPAACLPAIGSGLTSGYGATCAPSTTPSTTHGYLQSADATQTYLFMDGAHLTEAGQQIEADYFYNLLVAPSEISYLAETAVQTTFQTVTGIQQQIDLTQRLRRPGWNVWVNGEL